MQIKQNIMFTYQTGKRWDCGKDSISCTANRDKNYRF